MHKSQHPMGIASFTFAIINTIMIIFLHIPCIEFSIIGVSCAFIAFCGYKKYTTGLAIAGVIFSVLELILCIFLGASFGFESVSILISIYK